MGDRFASDEQREAWLAEAEAEPDVPEDPLDDPRRPWKRRRGWADGR